MRARGRMVRSGRPRPRRLLAAVLLLGTVCAGAGEASAQTSLLYATGFESPFFQKGGLVAQDGWSVSGGSSADVVSDVRDDGGSQSVRISRTGDDGAADGRFQKRFGGHGVLGVQVDWDMRVEPTTASVGSSGSPPWGPLFGIDLVHEGGGSVAFIGVDATTGQLVTSQPGDGGSVLGHGHTIDLDQWTSFRLIADYATQSFDLLISNRYAYVPVLEDVGFGRSVGGGDEFLAAAFTTLGRGDDPASLALDGAARFDNFVVFATVPEPGSVSALGVVGLCLWRRRRR